MAVECASCGDMVNEYGTKVYATNCETCGRFYSICPYPEKGTEHRWNNCLAPECGSYDKDRDVDLMLDNGLEIEEDKP